MFKDFTSTKIARFGRGATILRARSGAPLADAAIRDAAPSIFAEGAHESRSARYSYIPTIDVLRGLRKEGFHPYEVRQGGTGDESRRGFTKHMVRLRHESAGLLGDSVRELVLLNAHDGTSSYQLMSGLFRMVCSNGLVTCEDGQLQKIAHTGDVVGKVIEGAFRVISDGPALAEQVAEMRGLELTPAEQVAFSRAALELRYTAKDDAGEVRPAPIAAAEANKPRRPEDARPDLWSTFNRVQENLMVGEQRYTARDAEGRTVRRSTRPVRSIDGNVTLNRALWVLADEMARIKA